MKPFKNHLKFSTIQVHFLWLGKMQKVRLNFWPLSEIGKSQLHAFKIKALLKTSSRWRVKMLRSMKLKWDPSFTANIKKWHLLFNGRKTRQSLTMLQLSSLSEKLGPRRHNGKDLLVAHLVSVVHLCFAPISQSEPLLPWNSIRSFWYWSCYKYLGNTDLCVWLPFFLSDTFRFQAIPGESWQPLHSISGHSCPIRVPVPFDLPRYDLSSSTCLLTVSKCAVFNVSRRAWSDVNGVLHNCQLI